MTPPFRVEHVGSFVRPGVLLNAVRAHKAGKLDDKELQNIQDQCIRDIVAFQESIGLPSITDGEFRRRSWSAGFIDAVDGFGLRDGTLSFRNETGVVGVAASPYARARLKRRQRIVADDYRFLKSVVKRGVPKVTIAAPDVMHYFLGPKAFDAAVYRDREAFFADLARIYREEVAELAKEGCTYLQLDDTALPCNCDGHAREDVAARGEDADELTERYVKLINSCIEKKTRRNGGRDSPLPRQPERRVDGRGRLRADRRRSLQPARRRHLLPGIRHRAGRGFCAAALPAEGKARDIGFGEHQDARA
jgi:5-methyltetrahydropteroyltriglutamate--homocysteine methyltransferase